MAQNYISVAPGAGRLLDAAGRPFFAVIMNYVGHSDRAWAQFQPGKFDPALIEADFRLARQAGANTIRTFVAAPLQNEFPKNDWAKLDALVDAAERAGIHLLLALADYSLSYVQTLAAHAGLIAARFAGHPALLGYDLKNEPRFYHLTQMRFPAANPLFDPEIGRLYPPQRTPEAALAWARGAGNAAGWMSDDEAIRFANASETLDALLTAISDWISARSYRVSAVDFVRAPEAAPWRPFLDRLNAALAAWLAPQLNAVRAADPGRLVTVGWSDPLLAALPANRQLDVIAINRYPRDASPRQLEFQLTIAQGLQTAFPGKPVCLTEFGYATYEVEPDQAAICESAGWLRAYELGLAGAGKWMLWDLPPGPNPKERSFGLFDSASRPKPSALALPALAARLAPSRAPRGRLEISANPAGAIAYRFTAEDALFGSGNGRIGDAAVRWQGPGWAQLFVDWQQPGLLRVAATAAGQVTLDLGQLLGLRALRDYTVEAGGAPLAHTQAGAVLVFDVAAGQPVDIRLALPTVDAKIAILWPHGDATVSEARLANLTAHLTFPDSRVAVPCGFAHPVTLWQALNNEPAAQVAVGAPRLAEFGGRRVPVWDFNDVDVSAARDPRNKLYFTVRVEGFPYRSNVWVHGVDARTFMPDQYLPEREESVSAGSAPAAVDARIQILWPHGSAPVAEARLANLSVDLFARGTRQRLLATATWQPAVWLVRAQNNDPGQRVARGAPRWQGATASRWDFNDIDVSPARDPGSKLHFWVEIDGLPAHTNFWTHGVDARTYLPNPDTLLGDCS